MELCLDCKHISDNWRDKTRALCKHEDSITEIDPIDGQKYYRTCYDMRSSGAPCGRYAALFVPKKKYISSRK